MVLATGQKIVVLNIPRVCSKDHTVLSMVDFGIEASISAPVDHAPFVARHDELWFLFSKLLCRMELSLCCFLSSVLQNWASDPLHIPLAEVAAVPVTLCHCADSVPEGRARIGVRVRAKTPSPLGKPSANSVTPGEA